MMPTNPGFYRVLTQVCYWPLLIFIILWHSVLQNDQTFGLPTSLALLFWVVPLLLPLVGLVKGKPYTHAWFNFILMFYFLHGLTAIYTHPDEFAYAVIELILASGAFVGATGYARLQGRAEGLGLKKQKKKD
ncbi:MAG: DUF2069 domain-containing protein [Pseudomonadota bacterium]